MSIIHYAMRVATHLQNEGQLDSAELILKNLLEGYPTQPEALHLSGIIAYQKGNINAGIKWIEKALASNPNVALFHSNLGEMHRQLKALNVSLECGQRAIELDPHSDSAWSNLGVAYFDAKMYDQAEICHQRALAINPSLTSSLNNLGSIRKVNGNTQEAIAFYKKALNFSSNFIEPLNNLATVLLQQQEFQEALAYLNQAIARAPTFPELYCNRGLAYLGLNHVQEAFMNFEKALELKSDYAEAYYGIAKAHLHRHNFIEAEIGIRKAIEINSQEAEFYQVLARIYHEQSKNQKALGYLEQALSINPALASVHLSKGSVLMEMGEIPEAEEQFLKMIDDPDMDTRVLAHYSLVQLGKIKSDNASFKALSLIENTIQNLSRSKWEYLYFALGKCYEDLGESTKAFAYFTQGAHLKRQRIHYDNAEHIQSIEKWVECFTQETLEYLRKFSNPSSVPIFIVGMPRTGTSLVEQIVASHPDVYGAGELTYFSQAYSVNTLSSTHWSLFTENYLTYLKEISSKALRITDKMPQNFVGLGLIHALFPNAKIIHVKRNPIDTCFSCYTKLFTEGHYYSYDLTELGQYYRCYERIMQHWRKILPPQAFLEIEYEALIENAERVSKQLMKYCNLTWDAACLDFYESKRPVRTASFLQVRRPLYTTSLNRWRRFERELAPLIKILTPE